MQISDDGGGTWQAVTLTIPYAGSGWMGELVSTAPHPAIPGRILAGGAFYTDPEDLADGTEPSGVYASDDHGASWTFLGPTPAISEVARFAFDAGDPAVIYAGTNGGGLYKSPDNGATWNPIPFAGVLPPIHIEAVAAHPEVTGTVYVRLYSYAASPNPEAELYLSEDGGATWQLLPDPNTSIGLVFAPPEGGKAPYTLFTGCGDTVCRTGVVGPINWQPVNGAPRPDVLASGSDDERMVVYIGTRGGIATAASSAAGEAGPLAAPSELVPGRGFILGGGVYRWTSLLQGYMVYLPLVLTGTGP
jgi:hypothetical protein